MHLINHGLGDKLVVSATDTSLSSLGESQSKSDCSDKKTEPSTTNPSIPPADPAPHSVTWQLADQENQRQGFKMSINHTKVNQRSNVAITKVNQRSKVAITKMNQGSKVISLARVTLWVDVFCV